MAEKTQAKDGSKLFVEGLASVDPRTFRELRAAVAELEGRQDKIRETYFDLVRYERSLKPKKLGIRRYRKEVREAKKELEVWKRMHDLSNDIEHAVNHVDDFRKAAKKDVTTLTEEAPHLFLGYLYFRDTFNKFDNAGDVPEEAYTREAIDRFTRAFRVFTYEVGLPELPHSPKPESATASDVKAVEKPKPASPKIESGSFSEYCKTLRTRLESLPEETTPQPEDSQQWVNAWRKANEPLLEIIGETLQLVQEVGPYRGPMERALEALGGRIADRANKKVGRQNRDDGMIRDLGFVAPRVRHTKDGAPALVKSATAKDAGTLSEYLEKFRKMLEILGDSSKIDIDTTPILGASVANISNLFLQVQREQNSSDDPQATALRELMATIRPLVNSRLSDQNLETLTNHLLNVHEKRAKNAAPRDAHATIERISQVVMTRQRRKESGWAAAVAGSEGPADTHTEGAARRAAKNPHTELGG